MAAVSTESSLTEAQAKVELLSRQLDGAQQQLDASEGLERDLQRLGREAEEMQRKADHSLEEKQVRATPTASLIFCRHPACVFSHLFLYSVVDNVIRRGLIALLTATVLEKMSYY